MANDGGERAVDDGLVEDAAFLRTVVRNTTEGILTIDVDSRIVFANPAIEDILGYTPDALVGSSKLKIIPERLRDAHRRGLEQYVATGERHFDWGGVELPALHADGHEVPVSVSFQEHEYEGTRLFTGVFTDISERTARERRLREQKEALEEFVDVLSTDLRDPLREAHADVAAAREERESDRLRDAEDALERVDLIISDTLSRARHGTGDGDADVVSLRAVFRAVWADLPTGDATLETPEGAWHLHADRARLDRLAERLLENALEHAGPDVTVTVGVLTDEDNDTSPSGEPARTDTSPSGEPARTTGFYVEDDGPGFPDSVLDGDASALGPRSGRYGLHVVGGVAAEHTWTTTFTNADSGGARVEFRDVTLFRWEGDLPRE